MPGNDLQIRVVGDKEILDALKRAGEDARESLRPAIEGAAKILADAVRNRARNAWIKGHVTTKVAFDDKRGVTAIVGVERDDDHPANVAMWMEYGTKAHKIPKQYSKNVILNIMGRLIRGQVKHPGQAAQPFMRPAFDEASDAAQEAVTKVLKEKLGL